ncbi:Armadillo-like helical [Cucumis melo var. makuwa]|uniref:Armadillo-like helical n=1 Tax=Cucumis melo var. makuwa TaxID=1194695 RepID=A0A5D3C0T4_CUCMM|nr:Armadillo-like helical [Cucumis melo var. makuwa]
MKGLAKESLMDFIMFVNGRMKMDEGANKRIKILYHAARMISKQMEATWLFATSRLKKLASTTTTQVKKAEDSSNNSSERNGNIMIRTTMTI